MSTICDITIGLQGKCGIRKTVDLESVPILCFWGITHNHKIRTNGGVIVRLGTSIRVPTRPLCGFIRIIIERMFIWGLAVHGFGDNLTDLIIDRKCVYLKGRSCWPHVISITRILIWFFSCRLVVVWLPTLLIQPRKAFCQPGKVISREGHESENWNLKKKYKKKMTMAIMDGKGIMWSPLADTLEEHCRSQAQNESRDEANTAMPGWNTQPHSRSEQGTIVACHLPNKFAP